MWFFMFKFENQRLETLVIDYICCVINYISLKMFYHKLWLLKFEIQHLKNIGNQLHAHGNWLQLCKIVIKLFGLLVIDCCLMVIDYQRVKNSGKRFFFEKFFWTNYVIQSFLLKKSFYTYLDAFLEVLAYIESSLKSSLESWFLIEWFFDSWNLFDSWFFTWVFGIIKINFESFASTKTTKLRFMRMLKDFFDIIIYFSSKRTLKYLKWVKIKRSYDETEIKLMLTMYLHIMQH